MVAAVIPIIRLPKRFGAFDYIVPPEFEKRLRHGSMVRIQFRKKEVYGLVWNTTRTVEKEAKLKAIAAVLHEKPLLLPPQLSLLKSVVDWYGISLAHAATLFMPPLQKKKYFATHAHRWKKTTYDWQRQAHLSPLPDAGRAAQLPKSRHLRHDANTGTNGG